MKEVDLNVSELDDKKAEMLSTCLHNIEMLKIRNLTQDGTRRISEAINSASKPVRDMLINHYVGSTFA